MLKNHRRRVHESSTSEKKRGKERGSSLHRELSEKGGKYWIEAEISVGLSLWKRGGKKSTN